MSRFKTEIVPEVQAQLEEHLNIRGPITVRLDYGPVKNFYGLWSPNKRLITLVMTVDWYEHVRLHQAKHNLLVTALHEFRHVHQQDNWTHDRLSKGAPLAGSPGIFWNPEMESDAESWAEQNAKEWRALIRIKPIVRSSLSRLSQAEASLR